MRVVFFGTPAFAVPTLEHLLASSHSVAGVVTQPDRPRGRGQRVQPEAVKRAAVAHDVPVLQPERLKDDQALAALRALDADLGVVAAYGKILPAAMLAIPRLGLINVHASLLPRWRGAAPVHRAILAGDQRTGVTIMRVVQALDAGPMLARVETPIDPEETSATLEARLAALGAELLVDVVDRLAAGRVPEVEQDPAAVTYAARLTREDSRVDWTRSAGAIHDQIRGLHPWPLASTEWSGRRLVLRRSRVVDGPAGDPGTIVALEPDALVVATGDGAVALTEVQLEGRPPVGARAFLNGHRVRARERLTSPGPDDA